MPNCEVPVIGNAFVPVRGLQPGDAGVVAVGDVRKGPQALVPILVITGPVTYHYYDIMAHSLRLSTHALSLSRAVRAL